MKPFLIVQLRPETETADEEFHSILAKGGLGPDEVERIRLDQERLPPNLDLGAYAGIIVGGGPGCISDEPAEKSALEQRIEDDVLSLMPKVTATDFPFMGCCYGIGILAHHLGAAVSKENYSEAIGAADCRLTEDGLTDALVKDLPRHFKAFVGHKEAVQDLPAGCVHLLSSPTCPFQMIRYKENIYATQFHPEADADSFALRIEIYKNKGYFPPEDAARLTTACRTQNVHVPARILANFVERYR